MILAGENIVAPDARNKGGSIVRCRRNDRWIRWLDIIRMDKIDVLTGGYVLERRRHSLHSQFVPSHMRHLKSIRHRRCVHRRTRFKFKPADFPRHNIQALMHTELFAFGKEQLETETNAQERLAAGDALVNRVDQAILIKVRHTIGEGAHSRKDKMAGFVQDTRIPGHDGVMPYSGKRLMDAPEIPHSIINNS